MEEYYFLFALALLWTIFASVQDLRSREVANWLSFSLLAFALAYRAFYALSTRDLSFFLIGVAGAAFCFLLALGFYYSKVFGGGDAKLLMGFGALLPVGSIANMALYVGGFMLILFFAGSVYSILYSGVLVRRHAKQFSHAFRERFTEQGMQFFYAGLIGFALLPLLSFSLLWVSSFVFLLFIPFLYIYLRALEQSCMVKLVPASKLTEGDWLEKEVRVGKKMIAKSVHGLSVEEIKLLRKMHKSVWIKEGVPFVPAFLLALVIMGCAFASLGLDWASWISSFLVSLPAF